MDWLTNNAFGPYTVSVPLDGIGWFLLATGETSARNRNRNRQGKCMWRMDDCQQQQWALENQDRLSLAACQKGEDMRIPLSGWSELTEAEKHHPHNLAITRAASEIGLWPRTAEEVAEYLVIHGSLGLRESQNHCPVARHFRGREDFQFKVQPMHCRGNVTIYCLTLPHKEKSKWHSFSYILPDHIGKMIRDFDHGKYPQLLSEEGRAEEAAREEAAREAAQPGRADSQGVPAMAMG